MGSERRCILRCIVRALRFLLIAIGAYATGSAQMSPWSALTLDGARVSNVYRWNGNDTLWSFDSGLVRTTDAPTSIVLNAVGARLMYAGDIVELRRPIETSVWAGVAVGAGLGGVADAAIMITSDPQPEGYFPGLVAFTGAGIGALVALIYGTDEVHGLTDMESEARAMAVERRLPLARTADREGAVVTIDNHVPLSRRISWASWWVHGTAGIGGDAGERFVGAVGFVGGYYNRGHVGIVDFVGWDGGGARGTQRPTYRGNVSLHYGRVFDRGAAQIVVSGGPGASWLDVGEAQSDPAAYTIPCATIRASVCWPVGGWFSLGVSGFAGANSHHLFGGVQCSYGLGDLD